MFKSIELNTVAVGIGLVFSYPIFILIIELFRGKNIKLLQVALIFIGFFGLYLLLDFSTISSALGVKCLALFMDSPVQAYGKYSKNIEVIVPEGETEESTTHDTLGKDKISFDKVYNKCIELLSN